MLRGIRFVRASRVSVAVLTRKWSTQFPYVQMRKRVVEASPQFAGKSIDEALQEPLGFKICVHIPSMVQLYPELFELGESEYDFYVDALLRAHAPLTENSETCVSNRDSLFLHVVKALLPRCAVSLNQTIRSSGNYRHDFSLSMGDALGAVGKENAYDAQKAVAQIVSSIHVPVFGSALPVGVTAVPAFATTNDTINIHNLQYDATSTTMVSPLLCSFRFASDQERIMFVEVLFKIICWLSALPKATRPGTPAPGVPIKTPNGHTVELRERGLVKTFAPHKLSQQTLQLIASVYKARLKNVEQGKVYPSQEKLLITTVGQPLESAITSGRVRARGPIIAGVRAALDQLHQMGVAHCDVALCNTFILLDNTVILGDLEYCRPSTDDAPSNLNRSIPSAKDAMELDELQFQTYFVKVVNAMLPESVDGA